MSSDGASPEYDFSLEKASELPHFDPVRIAEQAVWPAVDHLWRGDWRQDSYPGDEFMFPGRGAGLHESNVFNIVLSATCEGLGQADPEENGAMELEHTATVQIEKVAIGGFRDNIFYRAQQAEPTFMDRFDESSGLVAVTGIAYKFDTHEPDEVNAFQAVETASGVVLWVSDKFDEDELEDMNGEVEPANDGDEIILDIDKFYEHDIDNIITSLSILDAPEPSLRALRIIKGQPLGAEVEAGEE